MNVHMYGDTCICVYECVHVYECAWIYCIYDCVRCMHVHM